MLSKDRYWWICSQEVVDLNAAVLDSKTCTLILYHFTLWSIVNDALLQTTEMKSKGFGTVVVDVVRIGT